MASIGLNHSLQMRSESFTSFYYIFLDILFQAFLIGALRVFLLLWGVLQASASTMLYIELRTMQNYYWQPLTPPINQVIHVKTSVYFIFARPVYELKPF